MYSVYTSTGDKPAFHQMGNVVIAPRDQVAKADHLLPYNAVVKNMWRYSFTALHECGPESIQPF